MAEIEGIGQVDTTNVTDMGYMFSNANALQTLNVTNWDTTNVTDMRSMFHDASALQTLNLANWDTTNVTNMQRMFSTNHEMSVLHLGPDTKIQTGLQQDSASQSWYRVSSTDPATLERLGRVGTWEELATSTQNSDWQGGIFMLASLIMLDENLPPHVAGPSERIEAETFTIQPLRFSSLPFALDGHSLIGWNTHPDGIGTAYKPGDMWVSEGEPLLYAQWERIVPQPEPLTPEPSTPTPSAPTPSTPTPNTSAPNSLVTTGASSTLALSFAAAIVLGTGFVLLSMRKRHR